MIKWLVVDLGGVAAAFRPEVRLDALASECDVTPAEIHQRIFTSGLDATAELGRIAPHDVVATVLHALEHRVSADQLIEAWSAAFVPHELLLTELRSLNVSRCLFTNNGPMINHCLQGPLRDLASAFDQVICFWQIGGRKPESVAFEYVEQKLEAPPTTLLLVDDDHDNVHAATSHGWQGHAHTDTVTTMNSVRSFTH
jgi:HAD superfamily hydrolase (TIGR01509 family)